MEHEETYQNPYVTVSVMPDTKNRLRDIVTSRKNELGSNVTYNDLITELLDMLENEGKVAA